MCQRKQRPGCADLDSTLDRRTGRPAHLLRARMRRLQRQWDDRQQKAADRDHNEERNARVDRILAGVRRGT